MRKHTKPLESYIPKKHKPYIIRVDRDEQCYGWLYTAVLEWPDGFQRLVCEESISEFLWGIKMLVEEDREMEW